MNQIRQIRRYCATAGLLLGCVWAPGVLLADADNGKHSEGVVPGPVAHVGAWGSAQSVIAVDGFYFSGQPDAAGFSQAAAAGVTAVVNLRGADEVNWDVAAAVSQAGMDYYNEPLLLSRAGIDAASAERISKLVDQLRGETVLVQCASGNRVAIWWGIHLARGHGLTIDSAAELARQAGMKPKLTPLLKAHLE